MRYRQHAVEFKCAVVEQSHRPGVSVSRLAREHDINANQIFAWRKACREGRLGAPAFLPVTVTAPVETASAVELPAPSSGPGRLVLERRDTRLIIEGRPDTQLLDRVVAALLR